MIKKIIITILVFILIVPFEILSYEKNKEENISSMCLPNDLYGFWLLEKIAFWDNEWAEQLDRKGEIRREDYVGKIFEYQEDYFKLGDTLFEEPKYIFGNIDLWKVFSYSKISGAEKFYKESNIDIFETEGIKLKIEVENQNTLNIGRYLYIIDKNKMIINVDGLYIFARKVNPDDLKPEDIPKPPGDPKPKHIFGKWEIVDIAFGHQKTKENYIGKIYEYGDNYCILDGTYYENFLYSYDVEIKSSVFEIQRSYAINDFTKFYELQKKYEIDDFRTYLIQTIDFEEESNFRPVGSLLYYITNEHIYIYGDGVYFIATRIE